MEEAYLSILKEIGEDTERAGLKDTPKRAANAMRFLTRGYTTDIDKVALKKILSDAKINPLYHPSNVLNVDEIPKLGSGKTDFSATKKIAIVNDQA